MGCKAASGVSHHPKKKQKNIPFSARVLDKNPPRGHIRIHARRHRYKWCSPTQHATHACQFVVSATSDSALLARIVSQPTPNHYVPLMTTDYGDPAAAPVETTPMQDAMQRVAPAAASMPEDLANASKPSDTSLQLTACPDSDKSKAQDATGHKPCSPETAEDEHGLSTSSQDPDTLVGHDTNTDQETVDPQQPGLAGMGTVRAAGVAHSCTTPTTCPK